MQTFHISIHTYHDPYDMCVNDVPFQLFRKIRSCGKSVKFIVYEAAAQ